MFFVFQVFVLCVVYEIQRMFLLLLIAIQRLLLWKRPIAFIKQSKRSMTLQFICVFCILHLPALLCFTAYFIFNDDIQELVHFRSFEGSPLGSSSCPNMMLELCHGMAWSYHPRHGVCIGVYQLSPVLLKLGKGYCTSLDMPQSSKKGTGWKIINGKNI